MPKNGYNYCAEMRRKISAATWWFARVFKGNYQLSELRFILSRAKIIQQRQKTYKKNMYFDQLTKLWLKYCMYIQSIRKMKVLKKKRLEKNFPSGPHGKADSTKGRKSSTETCKKYINKNVYKYNIRGNSTMPKL